MSETLANISRCGTRVDTLELLGALFVSVGVLGPRHPSIRQRFLVTIESRRTGVRRTTWWLVVSLDAALQAVSRVSKCDGARSVGLLRPACRATAPIRRARVL